MRFLFGFNLHENIQQAKSILTSLQIPEDNADYIFIKKSLKGREGYIGWFTKMRFKNEILLQDLVELIGLIKNNGHLIQSLPKNLISYEKYEDLLDDIEITKTNIEVKKCLDEFPNLQRSLINLDNDTLLLKNLYKLKNRDMFFSKISRYKNRNMLIDSIKSFIEGSVNKPDFDTILSKVKRYTNSQAYVVSSKKENDIIIARVLSPSVMSDLGRGTSWCILSSSTFREYVPDDNTSQYIIWLTDMPVWSNFSTIGVTIGPKGFRTAHLKDDGYFSFESLCKLLEERNLEIKSLYNGEHNYQYSVTELLKFGVSKDDILKNKKVLHSNDISYFTKEDFERNNMIIQFTGSAQILTNIGYSREEILTNKKNLGHNDIKFLNLSIEEIKNIGFDKFTLDAIISHLGVDIALQNMKKNIKISSHEYNLIGAENVLKYNLNLDNIPLGSMVDYSGRSSSNYIWKKELELKIPFEYLIENKKEWNSSDCYYLTKEQFLEVVKKFKISGTLNLSIEKMKLDKKDVLENKSNIKLDISYASDLGFNLEECKENDIKIDFGVFPEKIDPEKINTDKSNWREIYDFSKIFTNIFKEDYYKTFSILKFYQFDINLSSIIFENLSISSYKCEDFLIKFFKYYVERGFDIENIDIEKLSGIIKKVSSRSFKQSLIANVIKEFKIEPLYDSLFYIISNPDNKIDVKQLEGLPDKYKDEVDKIINDRGWKDIDEDGIIKKWYSSMGSGRGQTTMRIKRYGDYIISEAELKEVYKLFEEAKKYKWGTKYSFGSSKPLGSIAVFFFALIKMSKLEEFKDLNYTFDSATIDLIFGHLLNTAWSNGRTHIGIQLTSEENVMAYKWLKENFFKDYETFELEKQIPMAFKYDKPYYERLFKFLCEMKSEYTYINNRDKRVEIDLKINNFKQLLIYFLSSKDYDNDDAIGDMIEFIDKFLSNVKLSKLNFSRTYNFMSLHMVFGCNSSVQRKAKEYLKTKMI